MRIQVTKIMRILVDPDPEHCSIPEVRISDCPGFRKWRLAAWPDPALGGDQLNPLNTVQYRKCVFQIVLKSGSEDSQHCSIPEVCVFQIVLESGSEDSQHCSIPEVCIFQIVLVSGSEDSQHCSIPEVCISDRPGVRKWRLATLFNTGSVCISDGPGVRKWWLTAWPDPALRGDQLEHLTLFNTGSAYFRSSWSPEVMTHSLAWSCPQGRSTGTVPAWAAWPSVPAELTSGQPNMFKGTVSRDENFLSKVLKFETVLFEWALMVFTIFSCLFVKEIQNIQLVTKPLERDSVVNPWHFGSDLFH